MQIGYARVSKREDQDTAAQIKALTKNGCKRIFEEAASGKWSLYTYVCENLRRRPQCAETTLSSAELNSATLARDKLAFDDLLRLRREGRRLHNVGVGRRAGKCRQTLR